MPIKNHIIQDFIMPNCSILNILNKQGWIAQPVFFSFHVLYPATVLKIKSLLLCIVDDIFKIKRIPSIQNDTDIYFLMDNWDNRKFGRDRRITPNSFRNMNANEWASCFLNSIERNFQISAIVVLKRVSHFCEFEVKNGKSSDESQLQLLSKPRNRDLKTPEKGRKYDPFSR